MSLWPNGPYMEVLWKGSSLANQAIQWHAKIEKNKKSKRGAL